MNISKAKRLLIGAAGLWLGVVVDRKILSLVHQSPPYRWSADKLGALVSKGDSEETPGYLFPEHLSPRDY